MKSKICLYATSVVYIQAASNTCCLGNSGDKTYLLCLLLMCWVWGALLWAPLQTAQRDSRAQCLHTQTPPVCHSGESQAEHTCHFPARNIRRTRLSSKCRARNFSQNTDFIQHAQPSDRDTNNKLWQTDLVDRRIHFCTKGRVNLLQSLGISLETFTNTEGENRPQGLRNVK